MDPGPAFAAHLFPVFWGVWGLGYFVGWAVLGLGLEFCELEELFVARDLAQMLSQLFLTTRQLMQNLKLPMIPLPLRIPNRPLQHPPNLPLISLPQSNKLKKFPKTPHFLPNLKNLPLKLFLLFIGQLA